MGGSSLRWCRSALLFGGNARRGLLNRCRGLRSGCDSRLRGAARNDDAIADLHAMIEADIVRARDRAGRKIVFPREREDRLAGRNDMRAGLLRLRSRHRRGRRVRRSRNRAGDAGCGRRHLRRRTHLMLHARDHEALAGLHLRGTAQIVRLQDRGGRNAMALRDRVQRFALRNDDRRAAIPAPRLRGRRLDLRGGLARLHRTGDLLARGLLIGADAGTAAIGRRGGDRLRGWRGRRKRGRLDPVRGRRLGAHRTGHLIRAGAGICGLRLIGPRALAETRRIVATGGEPGGKRRHQGKTGHGARARRLDMGEHGSLTRYATGPE